MKRVDKILKHPVFRACMKKNSECEKDRIFCRHDAAHFLSVARIGYILNLKKKVRQKRELIYAAALLHDIGRYRQYEEGIPHEKASAALAPEILKDCGFGRKETERIVDAIKNHRNAGIRKEKSLRGILYQADKLSRECYICPAEQACNWKNNQKNMRLRY